jgi:hypothetical protein
VDYSSARNDFGGWRNAPNHPNWSAFAVLKADGSIVAWGVSGSGGTGAPFGNGYTKIYSTEFAQQNATFLLFYLLFFASNLPIKPSSTTNWQH